MVANNETEGHKGTSNTARDRVVPAPRARSARTPTRVVGRDGRSEGR